MSSSKQNLAQKQIIKTWLKTLFFVPETETGKAPQANHQRQATQFIKLFLAVPGTIRQYSKPAFKQVEKAHDIQANGHSTHNT